MPRSVSSPTQTSCLYKTPPPPIFTPADLELQRLILIHRHGERTPIIPPPDWNVRGGELTQQGATNLEMLGERMRMYYNGWIGKNTDELYLRSTNYPRTIQSLQAVVRSLYPGQQIPDIHIKADNEEDMYADQTCGRWAELKKMYSEMMWKKHRPKIDTLRDKLNLDLKEVTGLCDASFCRTAAGRPHNPNITDEDLETLEIVQRDLWFGGHDDSQELRQITSGRFLSTIRARLRESKEKFCIFSGHDSTIGPIIPALGLHDNRWPGFGSNLMFELFHGKVKTQAKYVRVKYNERALSLPGCARNHYKGHTDLCEYDTFMALLELEIPKDYRKACEPKHDVKVSDGAGDTALR